MLIVWALVISTIIIHFKPYGFDISAGVFPCFKELEAYQKEIAVEFREGLVSKTIIHPNQIAPLHDLYKVTQKELHEAEAILDAKEAVFNLNGVMAEVNTQKRYAKSVLKRFKLYGIREI